MNADRRRLRGSVELLDDTLSPEDHDAYLFEMVRMGHLWNVYPLPDGRFNPYSVADKKRRGAPLSGIGSGTVMMDVAGMKAAYCNVLEPVLLAREHWVLDIPWRLTQEASFRIGHVTDGRSAGLAVPRGLFGGVLLVNEILQDARLARAGKAQAPQLDENTRAFVHDHFADMVASWTFNAVIAGRDAAGQIELPSAAQAQLDLTRPVEGKLHDLRYRWLESSLSSAIWRSATTQQLFMLLHEYGHLLASEEERWAQEVQADGWAIDRLRHGVPTTHGDRHDRIIKDVVVALAFQEIVRRQVDVSVPAGHYTHRAHLAVDRYAAIAAPSRVLLHCAIDACFADPAAYLLSLQLDDVPVDDGGEGVIAMASLGRGKFLAAVKQPELALAALSQVHDPGFENTEVLYARGLVLQELKRFEQAEVDLSEALAASPDLRPALAARGDIRGDERGDWQGALADYERCLKLDRELGMEDAWMRHRRALALQHLQRHGEAEQELDVILRRRPRDGTALLSRSVSRFERGRVDEAIADGEAALAVLGDDVMVLFNLACFHSARSRREPGRADDHDKALTYLERAVHKGFQNWRHCDVDKDLDPLRDDPRYLGLHRQMRAAAGQ